MKRINLFRQIIYDAYCHVKLMILRKMRLLMNLEQNVQNPVKLVIF